MTEALFNWIARRLVPDLIAPTIVDREKVLYEWLAAVLWLHRETLRDLNVYLDVLLAETK